MCVSNQTIETVYNRFKLLRQAAGWTSAQVAAELGVSRQTIVNIETKKTPFSKMHCIAFMAVLNERGAEVPDLKKIVKAVLVG
ncbi:MAG: helix-turn-helix transcriptional regulator [Bacillota bacterium]